MAKRDLFHQSRPESPIFQAKRDGGLPAKSAKVAIMARGKRWPSDDHHEESVWIRWFSPIFHWFKGKSTGNHGFYHQIDRAFLLIFSHHPILWMLRKETPSSGSLEVCESSFPCWVILFQPPITFEGSQALPYQSLYTLRNEQNYRKHMKHI